MSPPPAPRGAAAAATFQGIYMRPNPADDGTIPAAAPYCMCPDIWIAGVEPVPDFQTVLATPESYASGSTATIVTGQVNFIYVRGRNGANVAKTVTVNLYWSPSTMIPSPSEWRPIETVSGQLQGHITNLAPGAIGVCDAAFVFAAPPPPPGSDHYCLFAQFNDANNDNPFPNPGTVFDVGALIMNDLGWGWRNMVSIPSAPNIQMSEPLAIPADYPSQNYGIVVVPVGLVGWGVDFHCSQPDSSGNPIALQRTTITQDGELLGVGTALLDGGWQGQIFIDLHSPDGRNAPVGATLTLRCASVSDPKVDHAVLAPDLVDSADRRKPRRDSRGGSKGPTAWVLAGECAAIVSGPSGPATWRQGLPLVIPDSFAPPQMVSLLFDGTGLAGCALWAFADLPGPKGSQIDIRQTFSDVPGDLIGVEFWAVAGLRVYLNVSLTAAGPSFPPLSSLTIAVNAAQPAPKGSDSIGPTQWVTLNSFTFCLAWSDGAPPAPL